MKVTPGYLRSIVRKAAPAEKKQAAAAPAELPRVPGEGARETPQDAGWRARCTPQPEPPPVPSAGGLVAGGVVLDQRHEHGEDTETRANDEADAGSATRSAPALVPIGHIHLVEGIKDAGGAAGSTAVDQDVGEVGRARLEIRDVERRLLRGGLGSRDLWQGADGSAVL